MTSSFKLATWNVNSIRIRMDLLKHFVELENPDVICIQEVKAKEEDFPFEDVRALGYPHIALYGMAGYNGVVILSKTELKNVQKMDWVGKKDARHIKATIFDDIELNNIYIPAGGDIPDPIENISFAHKLTFMDDVSEWFEQHRTDYENKKTIICGDFNVAPLENDVWNHKQLLKIVSHTPVEVERITRLQDSLNFCDCLRHFIPESEKAFSWWSYRNPNWETNDKGRRLDHIWTSQNLKENLLLAKIVKEMRSLERPSDHVPVVVNFKL